MKRTLILLTALVFISFVAIAARYEYTFHSTPIAEALARLVKEYPEARITFVYNEMDDYRTSANISTDNLKDVVKAIVERNPITVTEKKGHILVEARQKGKHRYLGKLMNEYGEPVADAIVMLLNPKDSVVLTYGTTSRDGSFLIPCDRLPVLAKITSTGYQTKFLRLTDTSLGTIRFNTKTIELQNVNVVSDIARLEPDRTVFVPLQRQKNSALSGTDLIDQIGIPQLRMSADGILETVTRKPVAMFIDFLPASKEDMEGMNLQDVKRVEYLESPSDPRFMGEKFVVNFVMEKYVYGGYVKAAGYEGINMNERRGSANVRYQYKGMTYDLAALGTYDDTRHNGKETTETFRFPQQDAIKTIERLSSTISSRERAISGQVSFKATYSSADVTARTIVSGGVTDRPSCQQDGDVSYTPEEFPKSTFDSETSKKDRFVRINGSYVFKLPKQYMLTFTPSYTLSQTDQNSAYSQSAFTQIENSADDRTGNLSGFLNFSRNFGKFGSFTTYLSGQYNHYRTRYTGSAEVLDKSRDQRYRAGATYSVSFGGFYGEAEFGWVWDWNRFNDFKSNSSLPKADLSLAYLFREKHRVNMGFAYSSWTPNISYKSQAMIEENHLLSYTGNPNLTPSPHLSVDASYSWMPSKNGYIQAYGSLWKVYDRYVYEYQPDGDRVIRYIRQPMGEYHLIHYGVSGRFYLLGRSLILNGSIASNIARNGKPYDYTYTNIDWRLSATYWLKDFYFSGHFSGPTTYSDGFMVGDLYEAKANYYLMAGWANKNWNVKFLAQNFARWNWISHKQWFSSEYYDRFFLSIDKSMHANFNVSVTYTFNYGKKQRDESELNTSNASSSGILRN